MARPRATVETVNDNPRAWTNSSLEKPSALRYGTAGTTNTPVAPVSTPVIAPTTGDSSRSAVAGTERRGRKSASSAYAASTPPRATDGHRDEPEVKRPIPTPVPRHTQSIMGSSRRMIASRCGPVAN